MEWLKKFLRGRTTTGQLDRINNQLHLLIQLMGNSKDQILAAIAAEREQYLAALDEALSRKGISDDDRDEIIDAVRGIVPDEQPETGKHNVSLGHTSQGDESLTVLVDNKGCSDAQAARLRSVFDAAKQAGDAQPPTGAKVASTLHFTDNGVRETAAYETVAQIAAAQAAALRALLAITEEQLASMTPTQA